MDTMANKNHRWLSLAIYGQFSTEKKLLTVTLLYTCVEDSKELLLRQMQDEEIIPLTDDDFLMAVNNSPVVFRMRSIDHWKTETNSYKILPKKLIENTDVEVHSQTFVLKPHNEINWMNSIIFRILVSQEGTVTQKYLTGSPVLLEELLTKKEKSEHKPRPVAVGKKKPPPRRNDAFPPELAKDEENFQKQMKFEDPQSYKDLMEVLGYKNQVSVKSSRSLMQVLQTWGKEAGSMVYVWRKVRRAFVELDLQDQKKSLEILYQKDRILKLMKFLKENIRFGDLKDSLINMKIITTENDKKYFLNARFTNDEKLEYLFRNILLKQEWNGDDDDDKLSKFNVLLIKKGYSGIVDMLILSD